MNRKRQRAGDFRLPIRIERLVETSTEGGGRSRAWVDVFGHVVWAMETPQGGREQQHTQELEARGDYAITIRYARELPLDATMRVVDDGKYYNIRSINDRQRRREFWDIRAEETTHEQ